MSTYLVMRCDIADHMGGGTDAWTECLRTEDRSLAERELAVYRADLPREWLTWREYYLVELLD